MYVPVDTVRARILTSNNNKQQTNLSYIYRTSGNLGIVCNENFGYLAHAGMLDMWGQLKECDFNSKPTVKALRF